MREPRTTDTMLKVMDRFLTDKSIPMLERRHLWNIITALRGPDNDSAYFAVKQKTTVHIRQAAFPLVLKEAQGQWDGMPVLADFTTDQKFDQLAADHAGPHFSTHILLAAEALGQIGRKIGR